MTEDVSVAKRAIQIWPGIFKYVTEAVARPESMMLIYRPFSDMEK